MDRRPLSTGSLIGRDRELGTLQSLVDASRTGTGTVAMLVGEPGIGKTRTAQELAARARSQGSLILWGSCYEDSWSPPFGPWVLALRDHVLALGPVWLDEHLGPASPLVLQLFPELGGAPPDHGSTAASQEQRSFRLYDAIVRLLLIAAESQQVVLVLDDLHWADRDSLALLRYVGRFVHRAPLLVLGTYRDLEVEPGHPLADVLALLRRESDYERIALDGFSLADLSQYLAEATGRQSPQMIARAIHAETGGNPFYVRELVRHLLEDGGVLRQADGWSPEPREPGLGIPDGVRQVVGRRIARLSPATTAILRAAAAFPAAVTFSVLDAVTDVADGTLLDCLDEALRAGLIRAVPGTDEAYTFTHAIVRHTIYEELRAGRRAQLHRRIAEALEGLWANTPEQHAAELAFHFGRAAAGGDAAKAMRYARIAGDRAVALLAFEEGASQYAEALRLLARSDQADERLRCELLVALGRAQNWSGASGEGRQTLQQAAELARAIGEHEFLALAALGLSEMEGVSRVGVVDAPAAVALEQALSALSEEDSPLRVRLLARLAITLYWLPERDRSLALSEAAERMARRLGDPRLLAYALNSRCWARWAPADAEGQYAAAVEMAQAAERAGAVEEQLQGLSHMAVHLIEWGERAALHDTLDRIDRLAAELHLPLYSWWAALHRGLPLILAGRFADAERAADHALDLGRQAQSRNARGFHHLQLISLRLVQGRLAELGGAVDWLATVAEGDAGIEPGRCMLALLQHEVGREAEARATFARLTANDLHDLRDDVNWHFLTALLAEVCVRLRDTRAAALLYSRMLPYEGRMTVIGPAISTWGPVAHSLARLALILDCPDAAAEHFERALDLSARLGAAPFLARIQADHAALLIERDPVEHLPRIATLLDQAGATAAVLAMAPLGDQVRRLASRLRRSRPQGAHDRPDAAGAVSDGLTPREADVLRLIAAGRSTREIAATLVISAFTVERHITNLYAKIGARGRADATAYALRHALIAAAPSSGAPDPVRRAP